MHPRADLVHYRLDGSLFGFRELRYSLQTLKMKTLIYP